METLEKIYSVWLLDGDEVNDYYLTLDQAKEVAKHWASKGYQVTIFNNITEQTL